MQPVSFMFLSLSLSCQCLITVAAPVSAPVPSTLYESSSNGFGVYIWVSNVTSVIFGEDASDYDYHTAGNIPKDIESVESFASVAPSGDGTAALAAFLNVTMSGAMTAGDASNTT